jgi:heme oxygenase
MLLLDRLRAETAERHRAVERDLDLMRPDLTHAEWTRRVARFYGFYAPWEAAVERSLTGHDLAALAAERRKLPWLEADLTELQLKPDQRAALPKCSHLPALDSPARVLGSMYVLEGATLGGQVISRHVEATLGLSDGRGYSFFRAYGDATAAMWRSFRQTLSAYAPLLDNDTMVESACETFDRFHNWLVDGRGERLTCP